MAFFQTNPFILAVLSLFGINHASRRATLLWVLAIATEKQLPLVDALDALSDETDGVWRNNIQDFAAMIQGGTPMAEAAASVPGLLSDESTMAIRAAAESGTLVNALRSEAERVSFQQEVSNRKLLQTMVYVAAVATLAMLIVSFILVYIVPKFKKIFEDFGMELPRMTMLLIDISDWVLSFWFMLMPFYFMLMGAGIFFCFRAAQAGSGGTFLSSVFPRLASGSLLRCLSHVVDAGRPLAPAIGSMADHHPSRAVYRRMTRVFDDVDAGDNCWESMQVHGLLKSREVAVICSAERAGNAGWALRHVGHELDRRFSHRADFATELIRPCILLAVGIAIGFVVISLFLPIVKLVNDLS